MRLIQRLIFNQEAFKGATWGQHFTGCKPGTQSTRTPNWRWREVYKKEKYWTDLVHGVCFSLIITGGAISRAPSPSEVRHFPLSLLSLPKGPTEIGAHLPFFFCEFFSDGLSFQQKQIGKNGRKLNRWWKIINFISLESSWWGEHARAVYFRSSALQVTRI
jgi:hypothetical protein